MATALPAGAFNITIVPIDKRKNVVMGYGTITGNADYAASTWHVTPALLGVKEIKSIAISPSLKDSTHTTPVKNLVTLEDNGDGTYDIGLHAAWDGTHNADADGFEDETFQIFFVATGLHAAA